MKKKFLLIVMLFFLKSDDGVSFSEYLKFSRFNERVKAKLIRIHKWSKLQYSRLGLKPTKTLLYPFGGGDVLYPLIIFNDIDEVIIIGLEPAGEKIISNDKEGNLSLNLRVLYEMGYFRTKQMEKINNIGILSLMNQQLLALKATDINVTTVEKGFHINFKLNKREKKVSYYSLNLNDRNKEKWQEKLKKHENFTLFLKGASYILQQKNFEEIKSFLINRANVILQDDTGFSYNFLKKNKYKIKLYGYYWEPLQGDDNFQAYFQKDLMEKYMEEEDDVNVFDISYNEENWLFAYNEEENI